MIVNGGVTLLKYLQEADGLNLKVSLSGDLDIESTELVEEVLIPDMENFMNVNIDFADVAFVDSSGMGLLMNMVRTLSDKGAKVTVRNVREEVMEIFELLQLPKILGDEVFV